MAEETKALTARPKAFSLPAAPELSAFKTELGPIPKVADYEKAAAELKTSKDVGAEQMRKLERLESAERDIGAAQLATQQFKASAEADIARQTRKGAQDIEAGLDLIRQQFPHPQFHPTQENVQSMATLFSLIGLVGTGMGGGGKMSAMNALVSMNGMLKGWQQGRKDLWEREKVEFDKNMARVKAILDDAYKDADRAYKTLAYNREEAQALAGQSAAKLGGQVGKQILEKQGLERYVDFLKGLKKDLENAEERASAERIAQKKLEEQRARDEARFSFQEKMQSERFDQQWKLIQKRIDAQDNRLTSAGEKVREKNIAMIQGLRGVENLQERLRDKDIQVGLTAKVAPLLQRLKSVSDTTDFENAINTTLTGNDKTTLFLKDALLETYAIERAAKGGQRLTVQDVKMIGPVLDPTNYTPKAYNSLLEGRRKVLYENLQDNGLSVDQINQMKRKPKEVAPYGGEFPEAGAKQKPPSAPADARQAPDGNWYSPDPKRPGKYLKWN